MVVLPFWSKMRSVGEIGREFQDATQPFEMIRHLNYGLPRNP